MKKFVPGAFVPLQHLLQELAIIWFKMLIPSLSAFIRSLFQYSCGVSYPDVSFDGYDVKIHLPLTIGGMELRTIIDALAGAA